MHRNWLIYLLLILATVAVYSRVTGFDFIDYDDVQYVTQNPDIKNGLNLQSMEWAFTNRYDANWMPLVWLSFMVDHELGGAPISDTANASENPAPYHQTNLILHILNTLLLFSLLSTHTGSRWRSAFVAALFAVHPMHVQSVAWIAERKDVLSTFFMLVTLLAYARYAKRPSAGMYLLVLLAFTLGLMSKSMLVTVPVILLLMDLWPLKREGVALRWLLFEKMPLVAMAVTVGIVTIIQQHHTGALSKLEVYSLGIRLANAAVSYVDYLLNLFWPANLAVYYPHPGSSIPACQVIASFVLLTLIAFASLRSFRYRPYVAFGWFWYVVTLLPVIGILQVGDQAMADRYTYIPYIGLFVVIAWGVPDLMQRLGARKSRGRRTFMAVTAVIVVLVLGSSAYCQVGYWRDSLTLFSHAAKVTKNNAFVHFCLGMFLDRKGKLLEATDEYRQTLRLDPNNWRAANNLAWTLATEKDPNLHNPDEAVKRAEVACRCTKYERPDVLDTLAVAYASAGQHDKAEIISTKAIALAKATNDSLLIKQIKQDIRIYIAKE